MRGRSRFRVAVVFALVAAITLLISGAAAATAKGQRIRWDIISVNFATGTLSAGGQASSLAADGSKITLTGHGTFRTNRGHSLDVTGGGSWATFDKNGNAIGRGTYAVARFVSFELAPGTPPLPNDAIGTLADNRAGLAVVRVLYSDGSRGSLTVSCHLVGSPDTIFEGVTATKGFVDYFNRVAPPAPPGNEGRTTFHILR